jgi:hypothetical protein
MHGVFQQNRPIPGVGPSEIVLIKRSFATCGKLPATLDPGGSARSAQDVIGYTRGAFSTFPSPNYKLNGRGSSEIDL